MEGPMRRGTAIAGILIVLLCFWAGTAQAHLGSTKFIHVERTEDGAAAEILVDTVDLSMELRMGEEPDETELRRHRGAMERFISDGITLRDGGERCASTVAFVAFVSRDARRFARFEVTWACASGATDVVLRDDTVFADDPQHEAFVRVLFSGETDARILRRGRQETELSEAPGAVTLALTYIEEGALHLATGYDHILFLLSLVLAAGLVAAREGRRRALRDIAVIVTAFTLGHSVTLAAAALEVVVLPSRLVESLIAASIVVVALVNVVRPSARSKMHWLAAGFGLIHGFGFSAVLAEQGLPRGQRVLALFSFNVGIELAQLTFVALILFPLGWLARYDGYERIVVRGGSVLIALLAGVWLIERALG